MFCSAGRFLYNTPGLEKRQACMTSQKQDGRTTAPSHWLRWSQHKWKRRYLFILNCVAILSKHKATRDTWVTHFTEPRARPSSTEACSRHRFTWGAGHRVSHRRGDTTNNRPHCNMNHDKQGQLHMLRSLAVNLQRVTFKLARSLKHLDSSGVMLRLILCTHWTRTFTTVNHWNWNHNHPEFREPNRVMAQGTKTVAYRLRQTTHET